MKESVCECGDWKSSHMDGVGKCKVCGDSRAPYDRCQKFRHSHFEEKTVLCRPVVPFGSK